eukprot:TRINITY_DN753_c0_g1_i1.p1 TRINITY_DN753_c0_g1~~TRINITY_DN753_c0_g1_i1.p1  ORF type:complete len:304 (-),score=54.10 TRINITY_DN753_c0_g1_i1:915-1826(-)
MAALQEASSHALSSEEEDGSHGRSHDSVRACLKYLKGSDEKLYTYLHPPPPGMPYKNTVEDPRVLDVHNMRHVAHKLDIEKNGFEATVLYTSLPYEGFGDDDKIRSVYYPEVAEVVKRVSGASRVFVFDHTMRKRPLDVPEGHIRRDGADTARMRQPVDHAHVDYTERSGPQRVRHFMGEEAEALLQQRFAIIQVWRPLKGPVRDAPLAVCDSSTLSLDSLVSVDLLFKDRVGEVNFLTFDPQHKWYYLPDMTKDECIVFKVYDSDQSQAARFTPHTGFFLDPPPPDAEPRESIETRILAFWD